MPGRCSERFMFVQRFGKGQVVASAKFKKSQTSVVGPSLAKSTYCPLPVLVCVWSNLSVPVAFDKKGIFLGEPDYDALQFFIELCNLIVFLVSC
ncbi:hypothetical protein DPMN_111590 [Dreissena polymorpha]|uniref:Uncharacterized protein n=1 Tax=Dreissena polymorpha TaxID=45954 RepID=A0A9D4KF76_DREPO|nr:hypothetical protein DPMN_111590 [Dreissena polymorpha]